MGMYAKLMSRITESSLMEEDVLTRYVFMMLLAIADPEGYVVGTDIAIARRINVSVPELKASLERLMAPDPSSNSREYEGRRVIESDVERGYFLVNYRKYRDTRDEESRRNYMREYMQQYRSGGPVNKRKQRKPRLAKAEAEVQVQEKAQPMLGLESRSTIPGSTVLPAVLASEPRFVAAWKMWLEHLKQKRKPPTLHAQDLQLRKCAELGLEEALKWIANAIEHNWQGLYEPTTSTRQPNPTQRVDRNAGTTNAGRAAMYANVGKKVQLPNPE